MASAWSQLDQLLTCAICLDRYRNPKLLPCQHTFCMDPCLEGLIDYARRQIKCPECRAEHRIPYQGVQAFPTNVTLIRFLELHRDITGEEPEPPPSMMERCTVCSEKNYLDRCAHCDKKICQDCKEAHADVLRREINRINTQVRRGLGKLSDALAQTQKNAEKLQQNCHQVKDEIEEIVRRYTKDLRDTEDKLKHDVDMYIQTELRNLTKLKDDLDVEVNNMNSNCELVDKYISDSVEWTDSELVEYKDIFLKTLEFIRNFDPDTSDYGRKIRFMPKADPDVLHRTLSDFGELKINAPLVAATLNLAPPQGNVLMRSQSDHRLAAQFQRRQEGSRSYLDVGQRFGGHASDSERDSREPVSSSPLFGRSRRDLNEPGYRRYGDRGGRDDYMDQRDVGRSRFLRDDVSSRWRDGEVEHGGYRSRYGRDSEYGQDPDHHSSHTRTVRFEEPASSPQRERVLETDDASKGPLSGIAKLLDSPTVLERLRQSEIRQKQQEKEKDKAAVEPPPAPTPVPVPQPPPRRTVRQLSEDEIEKQKRQNQMQALTTPAAAPPPPTTTPARSTPTTISTSTTPARSTPTPPQSPVIEREKPVLRRVATLQKEDEKRTESSGRIQRQGSMSPDSERLNSSRRGSQQDDAEAARSRRKTTTESEAAQPGSPQSTPESPKPSRSIKPTLGKTLSLDSRDDVTRPTISRVQEQREEERKLSESPRPIQSSFYGRIAASRRPEPQPEPPKEEPKQETEEDDSEESESEESESESESESEESSTESSDNAEEGNKATVAAEEREESSSTSSESEEEKEDSPPPTPPVSRSTPLPRRDSSDYTATNRSTPRTSYTNSYNWDNDDNTRSSYRSKWWETNRKQDDYVPKYSSILSNRRRSTYEDDDDDSKPYSRFLARSRSSALIGNTTTRDDSPPEDTGKYRRYSTTAANLRRSRIARSKSSHDIGFGEESAEDETPPTPTYRSNRSWRSPENSTIRTTTRSHLKSREASPEEEERPAWSKYLRNKYGTSNYNSTRSVLRSRSSHAICSRSASENSSEDEYVPPSTRRKGSVGKVNDTYILSNPRSAYVQKKRMQMKIGIRGTDPGRFTWPRGVCVGPDNSIVVADSSNHRVQVFDMNGKFQQEFGTYGSAEGEFDCLAGVVVNRIGQFIVSDRYNHRIQVFDPTGRFLRAFGSEGRGEGRFSYPWGITTDSLGFIYICDKENHRIQVFQSDGTFVGKFGNIGTRPGQLEHPHYIAVTNTNRVVVSDTNNHRIQTFDVNGRSLSTFGTEGSEEGQFKFPRGIAVDDQGYIIVGDSGNNRIQIFHPDGTFLKAFGTWGSADGEFKGLEGIAVASNGNILVCDRENHRIQVF